jgi:O-antigen ligase
LYITGTFAGRLWVGPVLTGFVWAGTGVLVTGTVVGITVVATGVSAGVCAGWEQPQARMQEIAMIPPSRMKEYFILAS